MAYTIHAQTVPQAIPARDHLDIGGEPQLFLDKYVVSHTENLQYTMHHPTRLPENPILTSAEHGTTQPYMSVIDDPFMGRYRLFYNNGPEIWHVDSDDAIHWENPRVAWALARGYGAALIDDRENDKDPARRFKFANWQATRAKEDKPGDDGGMYVGFSPDGFDWTRIDTPVLSTWPEDWPKRTYTGVGDIIDVFYDPIHKRYATSLKLHAVLEDDLIPAPKAGSAIRRFVGMTFSDDFVNWSEPFRIFEADTMDEGLMEFYSMGGIHARGSLLIGFVRVLRDDLPYDPGEPVEGIGYAVLAFSRDGRNWHRFREPFLDRSPQSGAWDRAMTWVGACLPVDDELFIYYGGYARGHKVESGTERQLGMARLRKDGYMSLRADEVGGSLRTHPVVFAGDRLELNIDSATGLTRVEIQDVDGDPIEGFTLDDCDPIRIDDVATVVTWRGGDANVSSLAGQNVYLRFELQSSDLYAFQFAGGE